MTRISKNDFTREQIKKFGLDDLEYSDEDKQSFSITGRLGGLNKHIQKGKRNPHEYASWKKEQKNRVMAEIGIAGIDPVPACHLVIRYFEKSRRRDPDNIIGGGQKIIIDALVEAEIIDDDGWRCIWGVDSKVLKDADNPRVEVDIISRQKRQY